MGRIYDATWGRIFSAIYDPLLKSTEDAGLRERRREVLAGARGKTIDIGAGTGANLGLFPDGVDVVMAEPDPHMAKRLCRHIADTDVELVEAGAERLPFEDATFDTAVFTLVLCTVPNPAASLTEAARILKPGGQLLFVEHVRAPEAGLARWQDRFETPWKLFADGCHCNRDTVASIEASPLTLDSVERGELPKSPPITKPLAWGSASRT
ncbi:MAG: class I SAM-dependent methyltransferase [Solirubrobacterales bacterium]